MAEHLDAKDFGPLRLARKEVAGRVEYVFADKFFSDRCFLMSDFWSLITLFSISKHPSYSKSLKRIRLCPERLQGLDPDPKPVEDRKERRDRREQRRLHEKTLREEWDFYDELYMARILTKTFSNFTEAGNSLEIVLTTEIPGPGVEPRPWGLTRLQAITVFARPLYEDHVRNHVALYSAVFESKHEAEEVQIGRTCYALPMAVFRLLIGEFPSAKLRRLGGNRDERLRCRAPVCQVPSETEGYPRVRDIFRWRP